MKTLFFITAIGGLVYWRYTDVPAIQIKSVDWENQKVTVLVRGFSLVIDANTVFNTSSTMIAPIFFSKYALTASPNLNNAGSAVLQITITEGNSILGQPVYVDFIMHTVNGQTATAF